LRVEGSGFRVQGSGLRVHSLRCRNLIQGCRTCRGLGFLGFRVQGSSRLRVQGSGCRVYERGHSGFLSFAEFRMQFVGYWGDAFQV
jgi:hypothetical protein